MIARSMKWPEDRECLPHSGGSRELDVVGGRGQGLQLLTCDLVYLEGKP